MITDEKLLVEGCQRGDRPAQKALYDMYSGKMMAVCMRYVKNIEDAQDILQEGFIKVFTNLNRYSGTGQFGGWVRRIIVNCALEHLRRADVLREAFDIEDVQIEDEADDVSPYEVSGDTILKCIASLPDGFRTVFNLYAIEEYSHKDIGQMLGISEGTSRSQYARARKMLQKMILQNIKHNG
ncbi:MAG: RNA polymerase sigma factor [Tannerella sp.]|jgi:RNA polymerase sigma-70 factor (ECF subfamily)|nr:RNA polymerase sigma factor [Tannerella sp.]